MVATSFGLNRRTVLLTAVLNGPDSLIYSVFPQYETDALLCVHDTDRYDDRGMVETNLIESYDRLMGFARSILTTSSFSTRTALRPEFVPTADPSSGTSGSHVPQARPADMRPILLYVLHAFCTLSNIPS